MAFMIVSHPRRRMVRSGDGFALTAALTLQPYSLTEESAECWLLIRSMPHGLPVLLVGGVDIDCIGLVVERMGKYTEPFHFTDVGLARPEARDIEAA